MKSRFKKGFTLFEMMVSIAIFVVITAIAILNYQKFGTDVFISNLGYDIALSIRKAQSYGINVRGTSSGGFIYAYGIHFTTATNNSYKLFVDSTPTPADQKYTSSAEDVETYNLLKGSRIVQLCVTPSSGVENCNVDILDITFLRPNPDALIYFHTTSGATGGPAGYNKAKVVIQSAGGRQKQVVIYNIGQISVQ